MKKLRITGLLNIAGLFLAVLILIAALTEAANIQIIFIQPLYWSLDNSGMLGRAIVNLIVALAASSIALAKHFLSLKADKRVSSSSPLRNWMALLLVVLGLLSSLGVHYFYRCCESPWFLNLGFPMSWLHSPIYEIRQTASNTDFWLQHIRDGKWFISWLGLITDLLFWFNATTLLWLIPPIGLALKSGRLGNFSDPGASIKSEYQE